MGRKCNVYSWCVLSRGGRGEWVVMVTIVLTSDWRNSTNLISYFIKQNRNRLVTLPTDSKPANYEKAVKKE